jgi:hypothetical protein
MRLSEIFSRVCFPTPAERKQDGLEKLDSRMSWLRLDKFEILLENEMAKAEHQGRNPEPVKVELNFRNLKPSDITAAVMKDNAGLEYLQWLAEDCRAQLTFEVTSVKSRPFFSQSDKDPAEYARITITLDMNKPYADSRVVLADGSPAYQSARTPQPPAPGKNTT